MKACSATPEERHGSEPSLLKEVLIFGELVEGAAGERYFPMDAHSPVWRDLAERGLLPLRPHSGILDKGVKELTLIGNDGRIPLISATGRLCDHEKVVKES